MARLILFVIGVREEHRRQPVEAEDAVWLWIGYWAVKILALEHLAITVMLHADRQPDLERPHPHVDPGEDGAEISAELGDRGLRILDELQLGRDPAVVEIGLIVGDLVMLATRAECRDDAFGGKHARLDRGMTALDPRHIDEPSRASDQRAAREGELGDRLPPAFIDRARAIGNALAAFQDLANCGVLLPALKFFERIEPGIAVIERHHEAERNLVIGLVIKEAAAPFLGFRQRPALSMNDAPRDMLFGIDVP